MDLQALNVAFSILQTDNVELHRLLQLVSQQALSAEARAQSAETSAAAAASPSERLRSSPPSKFDGISGKGKDSDALLTFEFDLESYYDSCGVNNPAKQLRHAITLLEGPAKLCWRQHFFNTTDADGNATADRCASVPELIHDILKPEFLSANYLMSARNELTRLTQTGSVTSYISAFRQICMRIPNLGDEDRMDRFARGLQSYLQMELAIHPRTISSLHAPLWSVWSLPRTPSATTTSPSPPPTRLSTCNHPAVVHRPWI